MELSRLYQQHADLIATLFQESFLDEQFTKLHQLEDESNPCFVEEVVVLFFQDATRLLNNLQISLNQEPVDYKEVDACLHHFKGSSSSIGACRVKNICILFRHYCQERLREECLKCLEELKDEFGLLKDKLEFLIQIEKQIAKSVEAYLWNGDKEYANSFGLTEDHDSV